jgi:outer membrane protein assembly factor BamB
VGSADGCVYAFEAASGRQLWRFRVGPAPRRIPVYGKLISTWPVAGGVVVEDGIVYAAAGIAHYDGTHVVALDAITGEVKWHNGSSGTLSEKVKSGISLQGDLRIRRGELRFLGGGVYETARYNLKTGQCLNAPYEGVNARTQTAFYAYYPFYGQYLSFHHTFPDGTSLVYDAAYEGSRHSPLALLAARAPGVDAGSARRRGQPERAALWARGGRRFNGLILGPKAVLAAGQTGGRGAFLSLIDLKNGTDLWSVQLPAAPVKGGVAVDHQARIVVSLANGQVLCFAAK